MTAPRFIARPPLSSPNTKKIVVLVADPRIEASSPLVARLLSEGFEVQLATSIAEVKTYLQSAVPDFALLELKYNDGVGFEIINLLAQRGVARVVVHSLFCSIHAAVQAVKAGASDVLPKTTEVDIVLGVLLGENFESAPLLATFSHPKTVRIEHIKWIHALCGANISRTARMLSMHRRTLQRLITRHCLL